MTLDRRLAGVLLHPTSLPGRFGIGDLGPECLRFLDWMSDAGLAYWQVLPLGPTGFGDSPYQSFSAFAGNPLLVSPQVLVSDGLARHEDIVPPHMPANRIDYGTVIDWKHALLRAVHKRFLRDKPADVVSQYEVFKKRKDVKVWLENYALFRVGKDLHDGQAWDRWEIPLRLREKKAIAKLKKDHAESLDYHMFCQFLFFSQWDRIREAAHARDIQIIGDVPIYVAFDSADTWANQEIFQLDEKGHPIAVAGVPPDYFSATGQLWGNPLYRWDKLKEQKYSWWFDRFQSLFALVDIMRLDHFRGFMGYWSVPHGEKTAVNGEWMKGPGLDFLTALKRRLKELPIIAEDLGEISPDVHEARDAFHLPGMKILQFAWDIVQFDPVIPDPNNAFHPHNHVQNCVVYTGTHDNDTTVGWYHNTSKEGERHNMRTYLATDGSQPHWDLIRAAFMSVANTAIVPMQDFLGLGTDCRMNFPGRAEGNWTWRLTPEQMNWDLAQFIYAKTLLYQRCAKPPKEAVYDAEAKKIQYKDDPNA